MFKLILQLFVISVLIILQYSFGEHLFFMNVFNLMLMFVLFFAAVSSWQTAFTIAAVSGLAADLISYMPFGFYLAVSLLVCMGVKLLVKYMFTSLSLLSMIVISVIGTLFFWILIWTLSNILFMFDLISVLPIFNESMLVLILWQIIAHACLIGSAFFLTSRLSKHFNLAFLKK